MEAQGTPVAPFALVKVPSRSGLIFEEARGTGVLSCWTW